MNKRLDDVLRDAVEFRCRPNLDDIDAQNILHEINGLRSELAALKAENESLKRDAEQWRAYQKRKQDLIDRGFLRNPLRAEAEDTDGGSRAGHECPVCRQCDCVGCGDAAMAQGEKG